MTTPYGGGPADVATYKGRAYPGQRYKVYDSWSGGTQYTTQLLDANGVTVPAPYEIVSDAYGAVAFNIDAPLAGSVWVIASNAPVGAPRMRIDPSNLVDRLTDLEALDFTDLTADVGSLQTRMSTAEGNINSLDGRVDTLEAGSGGGGGASGTQPALRVYKSTNFNYTTAGTWTLMLWDLQSYAYNSGGTTMWSSSVNRSRVIFPGSGLYNVSATVAVAAPASSETVDLAFCKNAAGTFNGANVTTYGGGSHNSAARTFHFTISDQIEVIGGDYLELFFRYTGTKSPLSSVGFNDFFFTFSRVTT